MNKNNITGWFTTEDGVHVPIHGNESKVQAMNKAFGSHYTEDEFTERKQTINNIVNKELTNRADIIDYVKEQTNIDLSLIEGRPSTKPRTFFNVQLEKLSPSDQNAVRNILQSYGHNINIQSNGVSDYAISFEKKKKVNE
jgi:hypothetical protein